MPDEPFDIDSFAAEVQAQIQQEEEARPDPVEEAVDEAVGAAHISFGYEPGYPISYRIASSRGDGEYTVTMASEAIATCTCPGYGYRHYCKHIKAALSGHKDGTLTPWTGDED